LKRRAGLPEPSFIESRGRFTSLPDQEFNPRTFSMMYRGLDFTSTYHFTNVLSNYSQTWYLNADKKQDWKERGRPAGELPCQYQELPKSLTCH
jgi:hypothetical protein